MKCPNGVDDYGINFGNAVYSVNVMSVGTLISYSSKTGYSSAQSGNSNLSPGAN